MRDVIIIGAGVIGSAIARELSRRKGDFLVLERASDVCEGTSKANSGIVHAGFDAKPGSLKAAMNVEGSRAMEALSKELDFPYRRNGSLVIALSEGDVPVLEKLLEQGRQNGVEDLEIIDAEKLRALEPNISPNAAAALYAPGGAVVDPFLLTIALAENAFTNGVEFRFNEGVVSVERVGAESGGKKKKGGKGSGKGGSCYYRVTTAKGSYEARAVVNAAGLYADEIHNMVSGGKLSITPRKGEYLLMDRKTKGFVNATVFQCPTEKGKGVLVTPTVHGNLLLGPTSVDISDKENVQTTAEGLDQIVQTAGLSADRIPIRQVITSFCGLRAHEAGGDFVLGQPADAPGFFDAAGIESPGLTSAPAIGRHLADEIAKYLALADDPDFIPVRRGTPRVADATPEEKQALIEKDPAYANVVCRCETITEGEIRDAVTRPLGATTLDGIKRRVRAGMGRCQAGFCLPKQAEILAAELGIDIGDVTKSGEGAPILEGYTK